MLGFSTLVVLHCWSSAALVLFQTDWTEKQAMWQSDKRDEGEVTHSQDSREPDGATVSWQDCQHT